MLVRASRRQRAELDDHADRRAARSLPTSGSASSARRSRCSAVEQIAQRPDRLIALEVQRRCASESRLRFRPACRHCASCADPGRSPGHSRAWTNSSVSLIAVGDLQRFGRETLIGRCRSCGPPVLAGHPADRVLDALAVGGERRRRARRCPKLGDGNAIRRRQPIDEGVGRWRAPSAPPGRMCGSSTAMRDQAAAGRVFVRAVAFGRRRRRRVAGSARDERHPFGA